MFCVCVQVVSTVFWIFFFQAEDGIRDLTVTGVQTCALPISHVRVKLGGRHVVEAVADPLTGLTGKHAVDERREAVTDRMADDPVLIQRAAHQGDCDSIRALAPPQGPTASADPSSGSQACRRSSVR